MQNNIIQKHYAKFVRDIKDVLSDNKLSDKEKIKIIATIF